MFLTPKTTRRFSCRKKATFFGKSQKERENETGKGGETGGKEEQQEREAERGNEGLRKGASHRDEKILSSW